MHEALKQTVALAWGWADVACDEDGDYQGIDGNDTSHDDRDERLRRVSGRSGRKVQRDGLPS